MARLPRLVVPGVAHHITQRGNRSQVTFFGSSDFRSYRTLLGRFCAEYGVHLLAYCLMPNHIHAILVPDAEHDLARAVGRISESYARIVNSHRGWKGHLWQGRFYSCAMGDSHLAAAARYVLMNPVRAGLVSRPDDWPWSSFQAHATGTCPHGIVECEGLASVLRPWLDDSRAGPAAEALDEFRLHTRTGRPLGDEAFIQQLERQYGRSFRKRRPGPRRRVRENSWGVRVQSSVPRIIP